MQPPLVCYFTKVLHFVSELKGEEIIPDQKPLHHTRVKFIDGTPHIVCGVCSEESEIARVHINYLIEYVNALWGGRKDTIFADIAITGFVRGKVCELSVDAGGYFNSRTGIFYKVSDFPKNIDKLSDEDKEALERGVGDFLGWTIVDEGNGIEVRTESGMEAHEVPMVDADECNRILEYVQQRMQQHDSRLSE